jgi:hypothetical protein
MTDKGWICPKCGRVYGPRVLECNSCNIYGITSVPRYPYYYPYYPPWIFGENWEPYKITWTYHSTTTENASDDL